MPLYRNAILAQLGPEEIERLQLSPVALEAGRELMQPCVSGSRVLFLEEGLASTVVAFADGKQVEANLLGPESVVGLFRVLSMDTPRHFTHMDIAGKAFVAQAELARREFALQGRFQALLLRHLRTRIYETMQIAACNGIHSHQQRLARWLLQCYDRSGTRTLPVSQLRVSEILACRLASVSEASSALRALDIIAQHRGSIEILDPVRLEQRACECIHVIRQGLREQALPLAPENTPEPGGGGGHGPFGFPVSE